MILSYLIKDDNIIEINIAKLNIAEIIVTAIKKVLICKNKIISVDKKISCIL